MTAGFTLSPAELSGFDKATLEAYLRHVELWVPGVTVKIDDAKESKELPGFLDVAVHLSYNGATPPELHYFMSKDGKKIFKADVYDINKSPFQANIDKLDVKGAPTLGPPAAPVAIVVFSDFQCPMCRQEAEVIHKQITEAFPTQVRVYFRDFPLESLHNWAKPAAIAGRCVYKLNPAAFWDFHDWIYENQSYIGLDNLNSKLQGFATTKGLDGMQLSRCIEGKVTEPEVKAFANHRRFPVDHLNADALRQRTTDRRRGAPGKTCKSADQNGSRPSGQGRGAEGRQLLHG